MRDTSIPGFLRALLAVALIILLFSLPTNAGSAAGPITTPTSAIRFYQQSVNRGLCAQAYKLIGLGPPRSPMQPFLKQCAATKHLAVNPIVDPGYRIQRLNAVYTCLGVHLTIDFRNGTVQSSGGWYLLEKTPSIFWHILLFSSHMTAGGLALAPPRATCVAAVPPYAQPSSAQLIIGSAFLSATTGWIAVSRSGAYVSNGSCAHLIGANCDTAQTVIYRTDDGGTHWRRQLSFTSLPEPLTWMHFFNRQVGLAAATIGPTTPSSAYYHARSVLLRTGDGGQHWVRVPLPQGYSVDTRTISFPDPGHGWLWFGGGAMGSQAVYMYHTGDGGKRWVRIACVTFSNPLPGYGCPLHSGIGLGGDKTYITFVNNRSGWMAMVSNAGTPALLHSSDGGRTWHDQHIGRPPAFHPPTTTRQIFPMGTFDQPHIFGQIGILPEIVGFYRPKPQATWSRLYLYRSTDAGASWHFYQRTPLPAPSVAQYASGEGSLAQFPDTSHWIAVSGNVIYWTASAGRTWSHAAMHVPPGLELVSLSFADPSHGWAEAVPQSQLGGILGATTVLRTSDGGKDWLRVAVP